MRNILILLIFFSGYHVSVSQIITDTIEADSISTKAYAPSLRNAPQSSLKHTYDQNYIPSPEMYSLMEYVDIPVSHYTGVHDVSVPLYTIKVGNYEMPISISYHASGIKVAQEASRVGLGWSLQAGGTISRVIRGYDDIIPHPLPGLSVGQDDDEKGFMFDTRPLEDSLFVSDVALMSGEEYEIFDGVHPDGEPDIFYYNFGPYSGKFFVKKGAGMTSPDDMFILQSPSDNLHIDYDIDDNAFSIIDGDGVRYLFDIQNKEVSYGVTCDEDDNLLPDRNSFYIPPYNVSNGFSYLQQCATTTSWSLSDIILPSGEHISLTYALESYFSPIYASKTHVELIGNPTCFLNNCSPSEQSYIWNNMPKSKESHSLSIVTEQPVLRTISWEGGHVDFVPSETKRRDVRTFNINVTTTSSYDATALDSVKVFSDQDEEILSYKLHHSYFNSEAITNPLSFNSYLSYRLRLDSISCCGKDNKSYKYKMGYDLSHNLPLKNSNYSDKWGYYTGVDSEALFEPYKATRSFFRHSYTENDERIYFVVNPFDAFIVEGTTYNANGSVSGTLPPTNYAKTWILNRFVTPSKGETNFEYECNDIYVNQPRWIITDTVSYSFAKEMWQGNTKILYADTIVTNPYQHGRMVVECTYSGAPFDMESGIEILRVDQYCPNSVQNRISQIGIPPESDPHSPYSQADFHFSRSFDFVSSGNFQIILRQHQRSLARIEVVIRIYKRECEYGHTKKVGGIRISKITSPISTKEYKYINQDGVSSGKLIRNPLFSSPFYLLLYNYKPIAGYYGIEYKSNPYQPIENPFNNYFMGYSNVFVHTTGDGSDLKEEYIFHNEEEQPMSDVYHVGNYIPLNGKMNTRHVYKDNEMIRKEHYHYEIDSIAGIKAVYNYGNWPYTYTYYIGSYHTYVQNDTISITDSSNISTIYGEKRLYEYNPLNYQVKKETLVVKGFPIRTHEIKYSVDYPSYLGGRLIQNHMLNAPIVEDFYVGPQHTRRLVHDYADSSMLLPVREYSFHSRYRMTNIPGFSGLVPSSWTPELTYTYNNKGRQNSVNTRMGQSVVVLWGYHNQYPIAQIKGASLDIVSSMLSDSGVNPETLAEKAQPSPTDWAALEALYSALPEASITLAKYKPLIGIVEQTDPAKRKTRYTYDEFNRLKDIIEVNGENEYLLKRHEYKYATEE